jgi:hypothetical protein
VSPATNWPFGFILPICLISFSTDDNCTVPSPAPQFPHHAICFGGGSKIWELLSIDRSGANELVER